MRRAQADAEENRVELALDFLEFGFHAEPELDAHRADQLDFLKTIGGPQFVFGDPVSVQAAGQFVLRSKMVTAKPRRRSSAAQASDAGPAPMHATRFPRSGPDRKRRRMRIEPIHRVALQASDLDGLPVVAMHHAGAFAQHIHRADARTAQAQNIRIQNRQRPSRAGCRSRFS